MRRLPLLLALALAVPGGGCSGAYYAAIAQLGWARQDLLAHRIQLARDGQEQARARFADALPRFIAAPPGDASRLASLRASHQECAASAALVDTRLAAVEDAADALFGGWREQLEADAAAHPRERQRYESFRPRYERLIATMRDAQDAMRPVLGAMEARISALERGDDTAADPALASDGERLLRDLALAVALANQYVAELETLD